MEPIINPWILYAVGLCDSIVAISLILCFVFFVLTVFTIAIRLDEEIDSKRAMFCVFVFGSMGAVCAVLATIIPSSDTAIKMVIASNVTTNNIESIKILTSDVRDSIKSDVIEIIETVKASEPEGSNKREVYSK